MKTLGIRVLTLAMFFPSLPHNVTGLTDPQTAPLSAGPCSSPGYVSYCLDHLSNYIFIEVALYHAPSGVHRPHELRKLL